MTSASLRVTATAAVSDVGRRRANNEDCVLRLDHVPLLAVADGMGGAEAGEVASATAIARLAGSSAEIADRVRAARDEAGLAELRACVERAFHDAHRDIIAVAEARGTPGMGTTLVVAEQLGRCWLGCDNAEQHNEWAIQRLERVIKKSVPEWIEHDRRNAQRRESIR